MFETLLIAATAGNAVGTLTVPANTAHKVLYGMVSLTTSADVADRTVVLTAKDGTTVRFTVPSGAVQAANVTARQHTFFPEATRETTVVGNTLMIPMPQLILFNAQTLNISVTNGVVADSFTASFIVERL